MKNLFANTQVRKFISIIPRPIFQTLYYTYSSLVSHNELINNKRLKNLYKGKRCFFIGNGPSLVEMDLSFLANEYVFAANSFSAHPQAKLTKPDFYSSIVPWRFVVENNTRKKTIESIKRICRINKHIILFLNIDYKKYIERNNLFNGYRIFYLKALLPILESYKFYSDISKPHSFTDGSAYNAFACLSYMGFDKIYFIGCDTTFRKNSDFDHFYNEKTHPTMKDNIIVNNEELYLHYYLELKRWRLVVNYFRKKGVKILNAGIGGNNDVCPRVDYSLLFKA